VSRSYASWLKSSWGKGPCSRGEYRADETSFPKGTGEGEKKGLDWRKAGSGFVGRNISCGKGQGGARLKT